MSTWLTLLGLVSLCTVYKVTHWGRDRHICAIELGHGLVNGLSYARRPEPILRYCDVNPREQYSVAFISKCEGFNLRKSICKCRQNGVHFTWPPYMSHRGNLNTYTWEENIAWLWNVVKIHSFVSISLFTMKVRNFLLEVRFSCSSISTTLFLGNLHWSPCYFIRHGVLQHWCWGTYYIND